MPRKRVTTRFTATFDGVRDAAASLRAFLGVYSLPSVTSSRIELALVESLNNIVEHSGVRPSDMIDLRLSSNGAVLEMVIADPGQPLDETQMNRIAEESAQPEEVQDHGRGLALIRTIVDRMAYTREYGRNVLTLTCAIGEARS